MADSYTVASEAASILGPTLRFKGELSAAEALVINGQVEGTIGPAPKVTIGPDAQVKAGVNADVITATADGFRDRLWPKTVISFLLLAAILTTLSIQFVTPTRRWRPSLPGPVRRLIRRRSAT